MNTRTWKLKTIVAGICAMSLFMSLVYPADVWAAGNETVQIGNVEEDSAEKGEEGSSPSSDSEPEDVTLEDQETEESEVENQETEEPASEEQKIDKDSSEEQLGVKIQKKQKVKEAEPWEFIEEHDLQLQYDDRYSADSVKAGWKVASVTTEEVRSNRVAAGKKYRRARYGCYPVCRAIRCGACCGWSWGGRDSSCAGEEVGDSQGDLRGSGEGG